jgi:site-specific DNA-adenine methylase
VARWNGRGNFQAGIRMIPYQGGKNLIANELLAQIPEADNFYDLFGGGGAITEAAYNAWRIEDGLFELPPKWKYIHYNEIKYPVYELCKQVWNGEFDFKRTEKTLTKKEFMEQRKENSAWGAYVNLIWSYNYNGESFMLDNADFKEIKRRLKIIKQSPLIGKNIYVYCANYLDVPIKPNSVAYCDIPYFGARNRYKLKPRFCHKTFYGWALKAKFPVYFSDYNIDEKYAEKFHLVWQKDIIPNAGRKKEYSVVSRTEKLFWNGIK